MLVGDGCWEWTASRTKNGYARTWVEGKYLLAHRVLYELWVGPIPAGLDLDHFVCDNRACIRPDHVRPVTRRENTLRGRGFAARHAAKTECPYGHPYDEENTRRSRGMRFCRACARKRSAEYREKVRAR